MSRGARKHHKQQLKRTVGLQLKRAREQPAPVEVRWVDPATLRRPRRSAR